MSATMSEQAILELLDREAIRDCLHRYSRGIDRRDFDLLKTVFWQDAIDEHGAYNPSSRIGGFLRDPLVVDQRFSVKGLHYIG